VLNQVLASLLKNFQVLFGVSLMQRLSGGNLWSSTMHLQGTGGSDDDHSIWGETADSAFDIAELLHTHVGPEASFCEDVPTTRRILALLSPNEF
jgi:hypothetical protein